MKARFVGSPFPPYGLQERPAHLKHRLSSPTVANTSYMPIYEGYQAVLLFGNLLKAHASVLSFPPNLTMLSYLSLTPNRGNGKEMTHPRPPEHAKVGKCRGSLGAGGVSSRV